MQIITLTTDFGTRDYYTAVLKGRLLCVSKQLQFVDISHEIEPFDLIEAAFALRNAWFHFPKGTVHICTVVSGDNGHTAYLAIKHLDHIFLLPDNGIFSLAFPQVKADAFLLQSDSRIPFAPLTDAVRHLLDGRPFEEIGPPASLEERFYLQPVTGPGYLRGEIIHIDHYGNVITNITKELFDQIGGGRDCKIYFRKIEPITQISHAYHEVETGENLCLFNSAGLLEIAVNMGNAAQLYGLEKNGTVQIDFVDQLKEDLKSIG